MIITALDLIQDLIGAPFKPGGHGPDGYDCWSLVREVRRRLALDTPEFVYSLEDVGKPEVISKLIVGASHNGQWRLVNWDAIGGVVAIKNAGGPFVNHCGVVVSPHRFLHTLKGVGAHIMRGDSPMYRHRIYGVYEWQKN